MSHAPGALIALAVFGLLLAPTGYWLIHRLDGTPPRARDLGLALGVGFAAVIPLLWLERVAGLPVLVLPATVASVVALRRQWRGFLAEPVGLPFLLLPLALAALAFWADAGDVRWSGGAASVRLGFEMADRAFYALVSQEVLRDPTPAMQNPLFAGVTFAYTYFPALAGLLLHLYGGLDLLSVFQVHLPVVSFAFIALAVDRALLEWGVTSIAARIVTPLLCVLGGDLSFLFPAEGVMGARRSAQFLAFCSYSAESLTYNPWMIAFPLVLVGLVLASRYLREGGRGRLLLAAWSVAALWQTKVFACVPLVLGLLAAAALLRRRRLVELAVATSVLALPWMVLSTIGGDGTGPRPLGLDLLYPVALSLSVHPKWRALSDLCASATNGFVRWPAIAVATAIFFACGLGVRLLGAGLLVRRVRRDETGLWTALALALAAALVLGVFVVGHPLALNGAQFLILPQLLLWMLVGPWLADALAAGTARRLLALVLLLVACVSPVRYLAFKAWPGRFAPRQVDGLRSELPAGTVAAATWLAGQPASGANLLVDWRARAKDPGGRTALYVAVLSGRRLLAYDETHSVAETFADERRRQVAEIYDTADAARAEALLDALGVRWVWVDASHPLRFSSARLGLRLQGDGVAIHEYLGRAATPP